MSTNTNSSRIDRRTFIKGIGATGAAGVGLASRQGPIGDAEAIAPAIVVGVTAAAGGAAAYDWLVRDYIVGDADSPPEGLTAEALENQIYQSARARQSNNASTFIDNKNLVDGLRETAYVEGKIAAIDALNEQQSSSEVSSQAVQAANDYITTVQENLLKSWNESVKELWSFADAIKEHPDLSLHNILGNEEGIDNGPATLEDLIESTTSTELADGTDFEINRLESDTGSNEDGEYVAFTGQHYDSTDFETVVQTDSGEVTYLVRDEWDEIWDKIGDVADDVTDGLVLWADSVYSDVQSGEIDVEELITPRERAAMMSEEEGMAQAIADLAALNIPVDVEREATIYLPHVDATVRGTLGITQDQPIESGQTYDPDEDIDGSVYLTYDVSLGEGTWGAYETGVDGGEVTFTDEPWPGTIYRLDTTAGETVELVDDDFTAVDADGEEVDDWEDPDRWIVDISGDVETAITEVDEVRYYAAEDETRFETIQLQNEFTVERIEDTSSGEEVESMVFESSEPQSDDNYITQEEWDELEEQNQELIEQYEESQDSGGGIGLPGFGGDGFDDLGPAGAVVGVGIAAAVLGGIIQVAKLYLPGN